MKPRLQVRTRMFKRKQMENYPGEWVGLQRE